MAIDLQSVLSTQGTSEGGCCSGQPNLLLYKESTILAKLRGELYQETERDLYTPEVCQPILQPKHSLLMNWTLELF